MQEFVQTIIEICDKIDEYFPKPIKHLTVSTDHCNGERTLGIMIITKLEVKDAIERLGRFELEWWFVQPDGLTDNILILLG